MLAVAAVASTLVLVGVAVSMLYDAKRDARSSAEQIAGNLVLSIERDIQRNIELYDLSLRSTVKALGLAGLENVDPETRHAALFDSLPTAPDFGPIVITNAAGDVVDESHAIQVRRRTLADRDWFAYLRDHPEAGIHLSLSARTINGKQALVLSRRINLGDGSFGGAVAGTIYLDYFQSLFSGLGLDSGNVAALTTLNNQIVSRRPFNAADIGRILPADDVVERVAAASSGSYEHERHIDHVWRLYVFRHVGEFPLVMSVGLSTEAVYGEWSRKAVVVGAMLTSFAIVTGLLFFATRRELARRLLVEARLRESETGFRLLAEHASDMVTRVGADGRRLYVSPASARVFRVPPDQLVRSGLLHFVHRDDRAAVVQFQHELLGGSIEHGSVNFRIIQPQTGEAWVESTAAAIIDPDTGTSDGYVAVLREVTERRLAEASMAEANRWLTLSEQVGNLGHWRYKPASGRLHWSAQIYRIYGRDPAGPAPTLQTAVDACHPLDRQKFLDAIASAIDDQAGFSIDARLVRPDETVRHVQIRAVVETGADHGMTALFGVVVDVTDQVEAAAALQDHAERERRAIEIANTKLERLAASLAAARDEAQRANRAKSRFLAGMSHELRTPLNGILGYAQLLARDGELNPVQTARINSMLGAGHHLLDMVNQVLSLAEVELGQTELRLSDIDPATLAASCLDLVRPAADAKDLQLSFHSDGTLPASISTDATRLRQVLLNILGNAVKFTTHGGVSIHMTMAGSSKLRVEVVDSGPGICPTKRHRLFQNFDRLDMEGALEGAGLGLALSAQLASAIGGTLGHSDNPAGGSKFWLELPTGTSAEPVESRPDAVPGVLAPAAPPEALRILVVDDVAMNRDIASSFLRSAGHTVEVAVGGAEAVAAAAATPFDVILMDVRMPGMDGLQATRLIRSQPGQGARVPVLALTAQAFADQIDECRRAGMDAHLSKPFTPEALLGAVAQLVAKCRQTRPDVAAPEASEPAITDDGAMVPAVAGLDLPVLDTDVLDRTRSFVDQQAIATYLEAITARCYDLAEALRRPGALTVDAPTNAAAAHTLAGSSAMLGLERLSSLSRRLERALERDSGEAADVAVGVISAIDASIAVIAELGAGLCPVLEAAG